MTDDVTSVPEDDQRGRAIRVVWVDSGLAVHDGWMTAIELPDNVETVESVGIWIGENEHVVILGGTRDHKNEQWLNCQVIWKKAIVEKRWLW